jgi:polygalacturonase
MKFRTLLAILPSIAFAGNVAISQQIPLGSPVPSERKPTSETNYWYETIEHNGEPSFMQPACKSGYQVFRNVVTDFGADNTGSTDASDAIQNAINGKSYAIIFYWLFDNI